MQEDRHPHRLVLGLVSGRVKVQLVSGGGVVWIGMMQSNSMTYPPPQLHHRSNAGAIKPLEEVPPFPPSNVITWDMGGTMRVLATLQYWDLLITPPDVVTDTAIPLWCALLLAFAKNPLRQTRLLMAHHDNAHHGRERCQRHVIDLFCDPLTSKEYKLQKEYHIRCSNFTWHQTCILMTYKKYCGAVTHSGVSDKEVMGIATAHVISLFDDLPDAPPVDTNGIVTIDAFMAFGKSILYTLQSMCGIGKSYGSKQLTRSIISRFEPPCADITVSQLRALYPDQAKSMLTFAAHFGGTSMSVQTLANKATSLYPLPDGSSWHIGGWKLCCYLCQLCKIDPQHVTIANVKKLQQRTHDHANEHGGIYLSPSQYVRILARCANEMCTNYA